MHQADIYVVNEIHKKIEQELSRIGILFRVFSRVKTQESLKKKLEKVPNKYSENGKKIQDIFGMRVALYFPDDISIARTAIEKVFEIDLESSAIDIPDSASFNATRYNLIFKLTDELKDDSSLCKNILVDSTFEVQLRSILSEGWHEVEHDLRYKHNEDWDNHDDLSRALNGIYASLETADWSMMKVFEELAYRHYKGKEWEQMLRTKLRIRFSGTLTDDLNTYFTENPKAIKYIFEIERIKLIQKIAEKKISIPLNYNNVVHIINFYFYKNEDLTLLCPSPVISHLEERA